MRHLCVCSGANDAGDRVSPGESLFGGEERDRAVSVIRG